jgi:hypothetical protein
MLRIRVQTLKHITPQLTVRNMPTLKPAAEDLAARRPVWEALPGMFLHTDVSLSRAWRAAQLAQSASSIAELEHILVHEVYPV